MHFLGKAALSVLLVACTFSSHAQIKVDFEGESTFRGYSGAERDYPRVDPSRPGLPSVWDTTNNESTGTKTRYNVPRVVAELAAQAPYNLNIQRVNRAVSSTTVSNILNGGIGLSTSFTVRASESAAGLVVVNTGINDATNYYTAAQVTPVNAEPTFRSQINSLVWQAERTGKQVIFLIPNEVSNSPVNGKQFGRNDYLKELNKAYQNVNNIGFRNMYIISNPVSVGMTDGTHPTQDGYILQANALVSAVADIALKASQQQRICQLYVGFFNRVAEAEGAAYWYSHLSNYGENSVAAAMYNAAPGFGNIGLTGRDLITKYYWNVFGRAPDSSGLDYWEGRRQIVGNGPVLLEIINAAANAGNDDTKVLTQKVNVSMTYGFILQKTAVNTTALTNINISTINSNRQTAFDIAKYF